MTPRYTDWCPACIPAPTDKENQVKRLRDLSLSVHVTPFLWRFGFDRSSWILQVDLGPFGVLVTW